MLKITGIYLQSVYWRFVIKKVWNRFFITGDVLELKKEQEVQSKKVRKQQQTRSMKQHKIGEENKEVTYSDITELSLSVNVIFNIGVFRDVTPRSLVDAGQVFGEIRRLHFQSTSVTCSPVQRVPP